MKILNKIKNLKVTKKAIETLKDAKVVLGSMSKRNKILVAATAFVVAGGSVAVAVSNSVEKPRTEVDIDKNIDLGIEPEKETDNIMYGPTLDDEISKALENKTYGPVLNEEFFSKSTKTDTVVKKDEKKDDKKDKTKEEKLSGNTKSEYKEIKTNDTEYRENTNNSDYSDYSYVPYDNYDNNEYSSSFNNGDDAYTSAFEKEDNNNYVYNEATGEYEVSNEDDDTLYADDNNEIFFGPDGQVYNSLDEYNKANGNDYDYYTSDDCFIDENGDCWVSKEDYDAWKSSQNVKTR